MSVETYGDGDGDEELPADMEVAGVPTTRALGAGLIALGVGIGVLVPVFIVAYPAAGLTPADATNPAVVLPVVATDPVLFSGPAAFEIAVHAIGLVALFGFWVRFGPTSFLAACATIGGLAWMTLDIVDNAVTFHVLPSIAADYAAGSPTAAPAFSQLSALTDAVRLAGHFGGGLWMVGVSVLAIQTRRLPAAIGWAGVIVGAVFAANLFVPALLNLSFVTVPAWLVILGIGVARTHGTTEAQLMPLMAPA